MSLSDSFLAHVFRPSKNPLPKGIRKTVLKSFKGRRVARVNAWNKLPGWKQEIIRATGNQDAYLRGEITYAESRRNLRDVAVSRGIVGPVRSRTPRGDVRRLAGHHIFDLAMDNPDPEKGVSPLHIAESVRLMTDRQAHKALQLKNHGELAHQAKWHPEYMPDDDERSIWSAVTSDGVEVNVLWYH